MADQRLTSIEIEGFTSIRSARVELRDLNILVGANGAGKSNLIRVFELLGRMVDGELGLYVGLNGGASALLNATTSQIRLAVTTETSRYHALLRQSAGDKFIFAAESIGFTGDGIDQESLGRGHKESELSSLHGPGPYGDAPARQFVGFVKGCRVYHFDNTGADAPVKRQVPTGDNLALRDDAENLAAVLLRLKVSNRVEDRAAYRRITGAVRLAAPFFRDFVLADEFGSDRVRLRWKHRDFDRVFSANQLSDGTLRFICLTTLLLQPRLPGLVVLDEPELGLHPYAIVLLADMLRQASKRSQVLLATQSVTLMNQFTIEDLIVVEQRNGNSEFNRPDPETLRSWLEAYSLGELWEKNLIGGQPGSTGSVLDG
ncbi:AAA family ATPase [Amycolatopsis samaneae]|uniref:AAA family ATPase n=1 Tax=Amycolatopsis samaneae TaxID=664691 RepID=A0ABW5GKA8_9PSEU